MIDTSESIRLAMRLTTEHLTNLLPVVIERAERATDPAWAQAHRTVDDEIEREIARRKDEEDED